MHALNDISSSILFTNISAGFLILTASATLYFILLTKLRKTEYKLYTQNKTSFLVLISLICSFLLGYSAVLFSILFHYHFDFNTLFGPILFLGSIFVLATAYFNVRMFNKLLRSREILKNQALHDYMTKLPNRRSVEELIEQCVTTRIENDSYNFAVVFIDILNFKKVNDSFGHFFGDKILTQISIRLLEQMGEKGTVGRIGGDDFILVLQNSSPREVIKQLKQIKKSLLIPYEVDGVMFNLDASYGICVPNRESLSPEDLINRSNMAMRRSKLRGKNKFSMFVPSMLNQAEDLLQFENDFRRGLANNEFFLVFQPQYNLQQNLTLAGFEALVRWNHPHRGLVSPGEFIPLAEHTGLILELDRYVFARACKIWSSCKQNIMPCADLHISINFSAHHMGTPGLVRFIANTIQKHNVDKDSVIIELTESAFVSDPSLAAAKLKALKEIGVRSAIDDFGTGYSSLAYLTSFPTDSIKIDRSFIDGIESDPNARKIVKSVITLAHSLGMRAVAEGVENERQLNVLKELSCDTVQGFYLAKPLSMEETKKLIYDTVPPSDSE